MSKKLLVVVMVSFHFLISNLGYAQNCLDYGNVKIPVESDAVNSSSSPGITFAKDKLRINYSAMDGAFGNILFTWES